MNIEEVKQLVNFYRQKASDLEFQLLQSQLKLNRVMIQQAEPASYHIVAGDRIHDIMAARDNGLISIGCAYGYGFDEIKEADYVAQSASEIKTIIDQVFSAR
jgi:phosphoglycolate phosphatase-like HAD superfamily hydrolase